MNLHDQLESAIQRVGQFSLLAISVALSAVALMVLVTAASHILSLCQ